MVSECVQLYCETPLNSSEQMILTIDLISFRLKQIMEQTTDIHVGRKTILENVTLDMLST